MLEGDSYFCQLSYILDDDTHSFVGRPHQLPMIPVFSLKYFMTSPLQSSMTAPGAALPMSALVGKV